MIFSFAHFYYYYSGHQLLAPLLQQLPVQSQLLRVNETFRSTLSFVQ